MSRQYEVLGLARSSHYFEPAAEPAENIEPMEKVDRLHTDHPFPGSRRMAAWPGRDGHEANRKGMRRLIRLTGLEAVCPKPNLSGGGASRKVWPCLLRDVPIKRIDQVWSTDITCVPMPSGFICLTAVIDWHNRYVLSWRLSNTLDAGFCAEAPDEALNTGCPEVFNTDQGRASSSPRNHSPRGRRRAWTAGTGAWTTCSWNGFGEV
ncbi:DDE-type integrase/transposase/recombinase [Zavarzinella formosa]|uniref:DDE-type integrase/transposase/recombinase n=1 Tax=Zavarzinella formosa TaxID=360055 RepID=UPI0002E4E96E|nr:DDE-type integrase/transposase/recombinase [Zavarzinella formosa]